MGKIHIENGIISSSADYGLYRGTSQIANIQDGEFRVLGDLIAENYIVSSSVTALTFQQNSGSTIFGDSNDDTHQFTGSLSISGSIASRGPTGYYAIEIQGDNTGGPQIHFGNNDATPNEFMVIGAFGSINNINTQTRDFRIYDSGGFTGFYFDVSENKVGIGTTAPAGAVGVILDVAGDGSTGAGIRTRFSNAATTKRLDISSENAGHNIQYITNPLFFYNASGVPMKLHQDSTVEFPDAPTISGSASSTGSFGKLSIARAKPDDTLGINDLVLDVNGQSIFRGTPRLVNNVILHGYTGAGSLRRLIGFDGNDCRINDEHQNTIIGSAGSQITIGGHFANVSGSATSTGSFGELHIADKVGIGTTTPAQPLHVFSSGNGGLEIDATGGAPTLFFDIPGNEQGRIRFLEDDTTLGGITYETNGTDYIAFNVESNTERMRLLGSEKLTIGTNFNNNSGVLNIAPSSGTAPTMYFEQYTSATDGTLGEISFGNRAVDGQLALIQVKNDGANDSAYMAFHTEVTSGALTERVRIQSDGATLFTGQIHLGSTNQFRIYSEGSGGSDNQVILGKLNDLRIVNQHHGGNIRFEVENSSGTAIQAMTIDGDGNAAFLKNVSGSFTSTGSFGHLITTNNIIMKNQLGAPHNMLEFHDKNAAIHRAAGSNRANSGNSLYIGAFEDIVFTAQGTTVDSQTERMRITDDGDVLIATNDAKIKADSTNTLNIQAHQLKILGSGGEERFQLQSEGNSNPGVFMIKQSEETTTIQLNSDGVSYLNGGNVGIGNTNPPHPLTVTGVISGSGTGYFSNIILGGTEQIAVNNGNLYYTGGSVGIGTTSPAAPLHIVGDTMLLADGESDNAIKQGRIGSEHYDVDEEPFYYLYSIIQSDNNQINIGGGTSAGNAATNIQFYTAANNTTTTGTKLFELTGNKISGSSTSTGSFGVLKLRRYNQGVGGLANTSFGMQAGEDLTTGNHNVLLGNQAGLNLTTADENVIIGDGAGQTSTNAHFTVLIGRGAAQNGAVSSNGTVAIGHKALEALGSAAGNLAVGYHALKGHTTGARNIAIGYGAMDGTGGATVLDSNDNIMIGNDAGGGTWTTNKCQYNVGIGSYVMDAAMNGANNNVGLGYAALSALTQGDGNVALGNEALASVTQASRCIAIGFDAGKAIDTADRNIAIGYEALRTEDSTGERTTAIGYQALYSQNSGTSTTGNTAVGYISGYYNVTGIQNTYVGYGTGGSGAGSTNSHNDNTAMGFKALESIKTGGENVAIGSLALQDAAFTETANVAIGYGAMLDINEGSHASAGADYNIAIGYHALKGAAFAGNPVEVDGNIAIGAFALDATADNSHTGTIAIGHQSLSSLTSGNYNVAIGFQTLYNTETHQYNVAIGYTTLRDCVGNSNTGVGYASLRSTAAGQYNTALGHESLYSNSSTSNNTAVGYQSGYYTTGGDNTYVGYAAGKGGSGAETKNIAIGSSALLSITSGADNIAIGANAGDAITTESSMIVIGRNAGGVINSTDAVGTVAVGDHSLSALTSGQKTVAIGYEAMLYMTDGDNNTVVGHTAFRTADNGESDNVVIGRAAGYSINHASSDQNVIIGSAAGTGGAAAFQSNIAIGFAAFNDTGTNAQTGTIAIGDSALTAITSGVRNTAIGYQAGTGMTVGEDNVALGYLALSGVSTSTANQRNVAIGVGSMSGTNAGAGQNVAIGYGTLDANMTAAADDNTAVGYTALSAITSGADNVAVGSGAMLVTTTGGANTAVGYQALNGDSDGDGADNTVIGHKAMLAAVSPSKNVAIGDSAMRAMNGTANGIASCVAIGANAFYGDADNTTTGASGTVAIGKDTLFSLTTGAGNIAIGENSGKYVTTGMNNIGLGRDSLGGNVTTALTGGGNIAIGKNTLRDIQGTAEANICIGKDAGLDLSGSYNVLIGQDAGDSLAGQTHNTAIGTDALGGSSGVDQTVVVGSQAGMGAMTANADGTVIVGYGAGKSITSGEGNTMLGFAAGTDITTGGANTIIGYQALINAQTDVGNSTAIGYKAGQKLGDNGISDHSEHNIIIGAGTMDGGHDTLANNTAHFNVAIGNNAMGGDTGTTTSLTANTNVAVGHESMRLISSGVNNVAVGYDALENITVGERNTAVGKGTLDLVTTGDFNTAIGYGCDPSSNDGQNQTMIGYNVTGTGDNQTVIGNSDQTKVTFGGDTAITSSADSSISTGRIVVGDLQIKSSISGFGDSDTKIEMASDTIDFTAGNVKMLSLKEDSSDSVVINDDSNDVNFRVESDGESSMLKVDGGLNRVGIAKGSPEGLLHVGFTGAAFGPSTPTAALYVETPDYLQPALYTKTPTSDAGTHKIANIMEFGDTAVNSGSVILDLDFSGDSSLNSNHNFIRFQSGAGMVGSINDDVAYSTFTGTHISQRPSGSSYDDWKPGMIVKSTGNIIATGSSISLAWPEVELTTTQKDKAVMGVFSMTTQDDFQYAHLDRTLPRINYNALGEGMIRVTDTGGNIETGDYICSSTRTGHGEKQDDDLMHNYTVAKATQPYNFTSASNDADLGYKSVLIACTYHCG